MQADIIFLTLVGVLALHSSHGLNQIFFNNHQLQQNENLAERFVQLLERVRNEVRYDYIVFVQDVAYGNACVFEDSIAHLKEPVMILSTFSDPNLLHLQHSSNFLLLTCSAEYLNTFRIFNTAYQYMPHMIWLEAETEKGLNQRMEELCSAIHANGYFRNLIVTPQSLIEDSDYFSCDFQKNSKSVIRQLFANPFLNMQGSSIITECDQLAPNSFLYYDDFGKLKLIGIAANIVTSFAERYNANLVITPPSSIGVVIPFGLIANKTFSGLLDIGLAQNKFEVDNSSKAHSYTVGLMKFCLMIPLPHIRPHSDIFFNIIEMKSLFIILMFSIIFAVFLHIGKHNSVRHLSISNVLLNDKSIRGLLGQSFVVPRQTNLFMKFTLLLVSLSSILLCTSYLAYLQSHLSVPSLDKRMETYEDIRSNNFKIAEREDYIYLLHEQIPKNFHNLLTKMKLKDYMKLLNSMDSRYIYVLPQTLWALLDERQKLFQRKLFYYSSDVCTSHLVPSAFPLRPGLPYKYQFNQHILELQAAGFQKYWLMHIFLNMIRLKRLPFKNISVADEYGEAIDLKDFFWIWILYGVFISISILVFIGELLIHKIKSRKSN